MPLGITSYVDPGVYIKERIQPGSVSVNSDRVLALVGIAPRTKRSQDEAVIRGKVFDETLALAGSAPHIDALVDVCNRDRNNATLYRNGQALGLADWSFAAAYIRGTAYAGAIDTTGLYFVLSIDGKNPVAIDLATAIDAADPGTPHATATVAQVAAGINYALGHSSGAHYATYGLAYVAVATAVNPTGSDWYLQITSPLTSSASDVRVYLYYNGAVDANVLIANNAWTNIKGGTASKPTATSALVALTTVLVNPTAYVASATYTIDYVATTTLTDPLEQAATGTALSNIVRAGSYPGASTYTDLTDYTESANTITWDTAVDAQAIITSLVGPFAIPTSGDLVFSINGLAPITVAFTGGGTSRSAAQVVADINLALNNSAVYGPEFGYAAAVVNTNYVTITAKKICEDWAHGQTSKLVFYSSAATSATVIFGLQAAQLTATHTVPGVGQRPSFGSVYYTTYDYVRPTTDYTTTHRVYNPDQLYEYTSPVTLDNYTVNKLAIAGEIAFENGANSLILVQVNDSTANGYPTQSQVESAIDVAEENSVLTDLVVVAPPTASEEALSVYLMQHVANQSSILNKHYRRGWFGMPRGTSVGDPDTAGTFVYRSTRTLQPGNTSPARGRLMLSAPSEMSRVETLDDGREVTLELDGSYGAVMQAAMQTSLASPSDAMLGKFLTGVIADDTFETYLQGERYTLAGNGVSVITLDAGRLVLKDPLTTEAGGGKVIQFEEPASSPQKDSVTRAVDSVLDANCKGVTPDDLAGYILDIKLWVSKAIRAQISAGVIAPYRNPNGTPRDIDLTSDIQVFQDELDPRSFIFRYWFNLKYVAKRFFGEYSVDNPFFAG